MEAVLYQASQMEFTSGLVLVVVAIGIAVICKQIFGYE
jgi:hypothetical protein